MRTLLNKAIMHLLNEEYDEARKYFRQHMIARARQHHEALHQGEEFILSEDWDAEITSEEYFDENDLTAAVKDDVDGEETETDVEADTDLDVDGAADALDTELNGEEDDESVENDDLSYDDEDLEDLDDLDDLDGEDGEEGAVDNRLEDIKDTLADMQAEFDKIMSELDDMFDADGSADEDSSDFTNDVEDEDEDEEPVDDLEDEGEVEGDSEETEEAAEAGDLEDDMEGTEEPDSEESEDNDEDFEDIAESILADLDKVNAALADNKEVGKAGKSIDAPEKSPLPQKGVNDRKGGSPINIKSDRHDHFDREPHPEVKQSKQRKNTRSKASDFQSEVPEKGNKSAALNHPHAPMADTKSPVAPRNNGF